MAAAGQQNGIAEIEPGPERTTEVILVVEDDLALLRLIEKRLAATGHHTAGVPDGASALAWLSRQLPSLMLLDYSLPDMHGEQLLQRLEALGARVPFVVATGHGSESVAVEMMKRGAYDYLVKGASFMKLLPAVVDQALERVRQTDRLNRAEEQLRQARDQLELRVQQRTAELAEVNRRLRVEMEERRRAEEQVRWHQAELAHVARLSTVGEMVAELAHEVNQPLSAISSYAHACTRLLSPGLPDPTEELLASLNQVAEQADRAAEIIRRLRRFVTKAKPLQVVVDMNALVREVAELMAIDARMADVHVDFELTEPLPPVAGDRIQLEQVLVNLMRNGFEAMREADYEPRRLTIHTAVEGRQSVVVAVSDSGGGIAPALADRVFDRFFTTKPDGMGMGLPISRSIIKNHGGKLWVTPNTDRGSTFHFTLPIDFGEHSRGK